MTTASPNSWLKAGRLVEILDRGSFEPLPKTRDGIDLWRTVRPPRVRVNGRVLRGRKGFVTDFSSLRWWMRGKIDPAGRHAMGAYFHDLTLEETDLPKWECDALLYLLLRADGTPSLEASLFWLLVRTKPESTRRS